MWQSSVITLPNTWFNKQKEMKRQQISSNEMRSNLHIATSAKRMGQILLLT